MRAGSAPRRGLLDALGGVEQQVGEGDPESASGLQIESQVEGAGLLEW